MYFARITVLKEHPYAYLYEKNQEKNSARIFTKIPVIYLLPSINKD